ncbi:alpha-L-arabinofuranosidase C-terminal domain-containing protein [Prolixibacter sp. SD074]|uniref:alpha-L-arabinofuranosidase C-terminal domain-containing protein n=1 Tax=Prolixibacter sp. SD074 TaxID=2652391 RepID=UPI0012847877|nr:alpha-L-arabinofuranosidase C-terminal domain-containing protein [Prolixibacter sp. SD074]GET28332.1 hypothetical protein SD074_05340 [Prolixibacter sp. SD074]
MKHLKFGVVALFLLFSVKLMAQENRMTVYPDEAKQLISKEIYGQFAEHLGHGIYGGIYVGEKSDIPNIDGYRTDVVNALKAMKVSVIRWPGGCFADTYHWKDGIGPKDKRPSIVNVNWGGVTEDNRFSTFMWSAPYKIASDPNVDDYNWMETVMKKTMRHPNLIQGISLHYYTIPHNRVGLIIDEWGDWFNVKPGTNPGFLYQQNSMRDSLVAGVNMNIFNNHTDRVTMG